MWPVPSAAPPLPPALGIPSACPVVSGRPGDVQGRGVTARCKHRAKRQQDHVQLLVDQVVDQVVILWAAFGCTSAIMDAGNPQHDVVALLEDILARPRSDPQHTVAPRVVAEAVRALGIDVTSSRDLDGQFKLNGFKEFTHKRCFPTKNSARGVELTLTENVRALCGDSAVVLFYDYPHPHFPSSCTGQIRLLLRPQPPNDWCRHIKYYGAGGTVAFRFDSVLSHLGIMRGACPESPYGLKPGQFLPAAYTDETIKGGLYYYGALNACPRTGQGKWNPCNEETIPSELRAFCGLGLISILKVTNVRAGPAGRDTQWAKS
jgi:hypothetical protein